MKKLPLHGLRGGVLVGAAIISMLTIMVSCGGGGGSSAVPVNHFSISGTVTLNSTGLAGVTMTLSGAGSGSTNTDGSGNYTFAGLANGNYTVTPSKTNYTFTPTDSLQVVNGWNITGVDFTAVANANPTYSISGTVTSNSAGLAGVTMTLSGDGSGSTNTDGSGNYTFAGLANGSYTVTPSKTNYSFAPTDSLQVVNSSNITGVDFTATSLLTVQSVACPGSGTTDVSIVNFAFTPDSISISANSIVRWTNNGTVNHTVTSTTVPVNGSFDSSFVSPGSSVCFKFTTAGTYNYHCSIHTSMTGTVSVL